MGNIISSIKDRLELEEYNFKTEKFLKLLKVISEYPVDSEEYRNFMFLIENKEKIIRNRRLIDLLG